MSDTIIKYNFFGDEIDSFNVGDLIDVESYEPGDIGLDGISRWKNGIRHAVIIETYDYDGDADDDGTPIFLPAMAEVAFVTNGGEFFIDRIVINEIFKKGELYG
jgi:hypothetical protein